MSRIILRGLLLLVLFVALASAQEQRQAAAPLRAGAARVDITPDVPVALLGYENPENRISTGVHDRLYARAVAFASGAKRLVLISCDLGSLMFAQYFTRTIAERWHLQPDEILLCGTHTHSGPQLSLNPDYPHAHNFTYTEALENRLVLVAGEALRALAPATLAVARGQASIAANRRLVRPDGRVDMAPNPDGPVDPEVLALRLSRPGGAPFAVLFDYASHSRSLRRPNTLLSGDILGIAEQVVEKGGGRGLVAAAFAGASGDVDPVAVVDGFEMPDGSPAPTVTLGTRLGEEAARAAREATPLLSRVVIRSAMARVQLPPKSSGQAKHVIVTVAVVGEVAFVGLDCEASVEIGLAIKRASPYRATFVITICNGESGYLPTGRQHQEGGYEVERTGFGPPAADILVKEVVAILNRLR